MNKLWRFGMVLVLGLAFFVLVNAASAQGPTPRSPQTALGTAFTYQGQLKSGSTAYTGTCSMQFTLFDAASGGGQVGTTQTVPSVPVTNGLFATPIDFGTGVFTGAKRYMQIAVKCDSDPSYTTLTQLQELTAAPYALYAMTAGTATSATTATNFSAALSGDVSGTQEATTVEKLQGRNVSVTPPTDGQVLKWDQPLNQWSPSTDKAANVVVVAKSGGNYTTIGAALTSITTNGPYNRYLIWVAPGTYTETVTMKQYVDIEGAGELATKITWIGSTSTISGTVIGASNAELRFLTVENTGGTNTAIAIYNGSTAPRLNHLTATASGANYNYGIYNSAASPTMADLTALGLGWSGSNNYGIYNNGGSPTMTDVTATASAGAANYGVYNKTTSPAMVNVVATGLNGTSSNYGVDNDAASPAMTNVIATGSGGAVSRGVRNENSSAPTMTNVSAIASGGTTSNYGIMNLNSQETIQNSVIRASGGTLNYGIYDTADSGSYTIKVNNSQITANTLIISTTLSTSNRYTVLVGASQLDGGAPDTGTGLVKCIFAYSGNYLALDSVCH